ncbi:MAG: hypothetical protein M5R40_06575 [Anaerolineae bacterium]|nr:hypothetical protein [Anaerolineae bacterium]
MAINIRQLIAFGIDRIHYGLLDGNNNFAGIAGSLAAGDDSGAGRLLGAAAAPYEAPEMERITIPGDNTIQGVFLVEPEEPSAFVLETGPHDFDFASRAQGTAVEEVGEWDFNQLRPSPRTFAGVMLHLIAEAQSKASGSDGSPGFYNVVLNSCRIAALGPSGAQSGQGRAFRWSVTANPVSKRPYGALLSAISGAAEHEDGFEFYSENRIAWHAFYDEGSEGAETFTLQYTPAGDGPRTRSRRGRTAWSPRSPTWTRPRAS